MCVCVCTYNILQFCNLDPKKSRLCRLRSMEAGITETPCCCAQLRTTSPVSRGAAVETAVGFGGFLGPKDAEINLEMFDVFK